MATLDVALPEYLCSEIRDVRRRHAARQAIEAELREALESGPSEPMTREDWDDLGRDALERLDREWPES